VDYDYERDDGAIEWTRVVFHDVLAFQCRDSMCCTADDVRVWSHLLKLTTSPWLEEIIRTRVENLPMADAFEPGSYSDWRMYFDDAACIAVVARSFEVAGPASDEASRGSCGQDGPSQ
jgi:hypothetical protein